MQELYDAIVPVMVDTELRRGEAETVFSEDIGGITYITGVEYLVRILKALGKDKLGVGFNMELTGRENVYLNGAMLGFSNSEITAMYDDIVKFAELEDFMDQKLKNYSSGMQVRLAFSIAIRAKGDILILDEVLAVGDAAFQKKCNDYFASLHGKQTVILVTHSMENVLQFCDRAIMLEQGKIAVSGTPKEVTKAYTKLFEQ